VQELELPCGTFNRAFAIILLPLFLSTQFRCSFKSVSFHVDKDADIVLSSLSRLSYTQDFHAGATFGEIVSRQSDSVGLTHLQLAPTLLNRSPKRFCKLEYNTRGSSWPITITLGRTSFRWTSEMQRSYPVLTRGFIVV
jgi:hypothetical protein